MDACFLLDISEIYGRAIYAVKSSPVSSSPTRVSMGRGKIKHGAEPVRDIHLQMAHTELKGRY